MAARLMFESMRELEQEDARGPDSGALESIRLIPGRLNIEVGETKTLSVICDRAGLEEGDEVSLQLDPKGVVELVNGDTVPLGAHRDRVDGLSGRVHVKALTEDETIITAQVAERTEAALIVGVPPAPEPEPDPPPGLEWERPKIKVGFGKRKTIELHAPDELVDAHGSNVTIQSTDQGIVLRRARIELVRDNDLGFHVGRVRVEGRALGAKGKLIADLGPDRAECRLTVVERDDGLPELRIEFSDEDPGAFRAYYDPPDPGPDGSQSLKIIVRHPTIAAVLGHDLSGQQKSEWQTMLAEIITDAMIRRLLTRRYPLSQEIDAQTLFREHAEWQSKLLPKIQKLALGLVKSGAITRANGNGVPHPRSPARA